MKLFAISIVFLALTPLQASTQGFGGDIDEPTIEEMEGVRKVTGQRDADGDGFVSADDNCPVDSNPLQEDEDSDGIGDVCDVGAFIQGPTVILKGEEGEFTFGANNSTDAMFYVIDWDGDGKDDETAEGPATGVTVKHAFEKTGKYKVRVRVSDETPSTPSDNGYLKVSVEQMIGGVRSRNIYNVVIVAVLLVVGVGVFLRKRK